MRLNVFISGFVLLPLLSFSQTDSTTVEKKRNRFPVWPIPSAAHNIYGIAIGPIGSETICDKPYTKYSHGLNMQLVGQGLFQVFYINKIKFSELNSPDTTIVVPPNAEPMRAIHNGLLLSPFGTFTNQVNGASISVWMSMGTKINGVTCNLLWNRYEEVNGFAAGMVNHTGIMKGIQLGLVNKTKKLSGIQIGLWNKNEKRSLPFINWNFGR